MPDKNAAAALQNNGGGIDALLDDDSTSKRKVSIDPAKKDDLDDSDDNATYESLQEENRKLSTLYTESSKEGKRLHALTKEQEARISKMEKSLEDFDKVKPIIELAKQDAGFAELLEKNLMNYLSNASNGQRQAGDSQNAFADFDPTELGDTNSNSFKVFAQLISGIVSQNLSAFAKTRDEQMSDKERRQSFFAEHKDVTPDKLEEIVTWAKSRSPSKLYEDLYRLHQIETTQKNTTNRGQQNQNQQNQDQDDAALNTLSSNVSGLPPSLAATGATNTKQNPADNMFTMLSGILNQKDLGSQMSR